MQICTSLQTDNHASTPPLSFLQAGCPSCRPTKQRQSTEGTRRETLEITEIEQSFAIWVSFLPTTITVKTLKRRQTTL